MFSHPFLCLLVLRARWRHFSLRSDIVVWFQSKRHGFSQSSPIAFPCLSKQALMSSISKGKRDYWKIWEVRNLIYSTFTMKYERLLRRLWWCIWVVFVNINGWKRRTTTECFQKNSQIVLEIFTPYDIVRCKRDPFSKRILFQCCFHGYAFCWSCVHKSTLHSVIIQSAVVRYVRT